MVYHQFHSIMYLMILVWKYLWRARFYIDTFAERPRSEPSARVERTRLVPSLSQ